MARQTKREQPRTSAVEDCGGDLRANPDKGRAEKRGGQGIELHGRIVGILPRQQSLSRPDCPTEICGTLVKVR